MTDKTLSEEAQIKSEDASSAYNAAMEALLRQYDVVVPIIHDLGADEKSSDSASASLNYEVAQNTMRCIRNARPSDRVCLILHTLGGLCLAAQMIAHQIRKHPGETTVFVPYIAMSGGTLVALAADRLVLGQSARLGPTDSLTCGYQSSSFAKIREDKNLDRIDDHTLLISYDAQKYDAYARQTARKLLNPVHYRSGEERYSVADILAGDQNSHGRGFDSEDLLELGVRLADVDDCPSEVYALVDA